MQTGLLKAKRPTICQKIKELKKLSKVKVSVLRKMYPRHFEQFFQFLNFLACGWPFGQKTLFCNLDALNDLFGRIKVAHEY